MSKKSTIAITSNKQYDSLVILFELLEKLGLDKPERARVELEEEEGPYWIMCDYCHECQAECICDDAPRYDDVYCDESSFE